MTITQEHQNKSEFTSTHKNGIAWEHKLKYGYLKQRIAGGVYHSVGVILDNTVKACGNNNLGQCDVRDWTDITDVACTSTATLGLSKDGSVHLAGKVPFNSDNSIIAGTHPSEWKNVKSIFGCLTPKDHFVGLLNDGRVVAYGCNDDGQCDVKEWNNITDVCIQAALTAGVRSDGTVITSGKDAEIRDIVSKWNNIERLYKGIGEQSLIGLKYDGTVVSTMNMPTADMSKWEGIIDISVGFNCIVGLSGNGHLYFVGNPKKVPSNLLINGIDNVLSMDATLDLIFVSRKNDTISLINLNRSPDDNTVTLSPGALEFQSGFNHKMFVEKQGNVNTITISMEYGQDATDSWIVIDNTKNEPESHNTPAPKNNNSQQQDNNTISPPCIDESLSPDNNKTVKKPSGKCYVATCVYGSYDCPQVWTLRRYRDDTLGSTWYGRLFIRTYYAISPTLVKWFGNTAWFKKLWRGKLDRMVAKLQENGIEDTPYEDKNW